MFFFSWLCKDRWALRATGSRLHEKHAKVSPSVMPTYFLKGKNFIVLPASHTHNVTVKFFFSPFLDFGTNLPFSTQFFTQTLWLTTIFFSCWYFTLDCRLRPTWSAEKLKMKFFFLMNFILGLKLHLNFCLP